MSAFDQFLIECALDCVEGRPLVEAILQLPPDQFDGVEAALYRLGENFCPACGTHRRDHDFECVDGFGGDA